MKNMSRFFFFAVFFLSQLVSAQPYSYQETSATYTPLAGATSINNGSVWSSFQSFTVPTGFPFTYMGTNFSTIHMEGSGFTRFDPNYFFMIMPFTAQLKDKGTSASLSPLSYQVSGTSPNRICKIEWSNCGFVNEATSTANFQLWLYETTNVIEIHIGPCTVNNPAQAYSGNGFPGPVCGLFQYTSLTDCSYGHTVMYTPPAENDSVFSGPNVSLFDYSLNGTPLANTVYRFTPDPNGIGEISPNTISVYPNPATDQLFIQTTSAVEIIIRDACGKIVRAERTAPGSSINIADLSPGLYIAEARIEDQVIRQTFIKQ
jgi:hypothetical protein